MHNKVYTEPLNKPLQKLKQLSVLKRNLASKRVRDCSEKPTARRRRCEDLQRKARPFSGNAQIFYKLTIAASAQRSPSIAAETIPPA